MPHRTFVSFSDRTWKQVQDLIKNHGYQSIKEVVTTAIDRLYMSNPAKRDDPSKKKQ